MSRTPSHDEHLRLASDLSCINLSQRRQLNGQALAILEIPVFVGMVASSQGAGGKGQLRVDHVDVDGYYHQAYTFHVHSSN